MGPIEIIDGFKLPSKPLAGGGGYNTKVTNWVFVPNKMLPNQTVRSSVKIELTYHVQSRPNKVFIRIGQQGFYLANIKIIKNLSGMKHLM